MTDSDNLTSDNPSSLSRPDGSTIAYHRTPASDSGKTLPGLVFLGGFMSDMTGTKATELEAFARQRGQAFVRFDYQGHGQSSGAFTDGTIGRWADDAIAVIDELTEGPQVLIGSSMGGWIMLLAALARPDRVAGLIGLAAAPDFTEDLMYADFSQEARDALERDGIYHMPSDYGDEPYPITRRLIDEGRSHLLLRGRIPISVPVRLIQGMADTDVPWQHGVRLLEHLASDDATLTLAKSSDHRLSEPADLARLRDTVAALSEQVAPQA